MVNQAANNALAAISANLHPGHWVKTEAAEENLRSFNEWFDSYQRWTNVCLRGVQMDDSMKWDMLVAAAGTDLHDIMKEAGIVTVLRNGANAIPWAAYVPEQVHVPAGPGGEPPEIPHRPAVPEQPYVPEVIASTPTVWETGLQLIRNTIKKYANDIMQRNTLMTEMPASN